MCIHTEQREKEIITEMKLKERRVIVEELANLNNPSLELSPEQTQNTSVRKNDSPRRFRTPFSLILRD